jgi:hypothetical protein
MIFARKTNWVRNEFCKFNVIIEKDEVIELESHN